MQVINDSVVDEQLNAAIGIAGNGGYGRLGHVKQQDEFKPRNVETFNQRVPVAPDVVSLCLLLALQLYHHCTGFSSESPSTSDMAIYKLVKHASRDLPDRFFNAKFSEEEEEKRQPTSRMCGLMFTLCLILADLHLSVLIGCKTILPSL